MISDQVLGRQARRLLDSLGPVIRTALTGDPQHAAQQHLGLEVRVVSSTARTEDSPCPIDGIYLHEARSIVVAASQSHGRTLFSILHEVGHHLIDEDDEITDLLWDAGPQRSAWARERFANEIAANLLLPDELVDQQVPPEGPRARDVISLIEDSDASAEACVVAAARRLPGNGYVVIAEHDGTVRFAATHGAALPIARHTAQPQRHLLARAVDGPEQERGVTLTFPGGTVTDPMHADAAPFGPGAIGVFTDGRAPWVTLSVLPAPQYEVFEVDCPRCHEVVITYKGACRDCHTHRCENCGWCECRNSKQAEAPCRQCYMMKPLDTLVDSSCIDCRS